MSSQLRGITAFFIKKRAKVQLFYELTKYFGIFLQKSVIFIVFPPRLW